MILWRISNSRQCHVIDGGRVKNIEDLFVYFLFNGHFEEAVKSALV